MEYLHCIIEYTIPGTSDVSMFQVDNKLKQKLKQDTCNWDIIFSLKLNLTMQNKFINQFRLNTEIDQH